MNDRHHGIHGRFDLVSKLLDPLDIFFADSDVVRATVNIEIGCTAIGDITGHLAECRGIDGYIPLENERRHIHEANVPCPLSIPLDEGLDEATRRVDADAGFGRLAFDPAELKGCGCERNDAMTTMGTVAHVVEEDYAEIGIRTDRLGEVAAVEVLVTARFQHDRASILIGVLL